VAALVASTLAGPAPLLAHAELVTSDPLPNASLVEGPGAVRVTFSEPIDAAIATVELLDAQLRPLAGVGAVRVEEAGTVLEIGLPTLEPGTYSVSYQVVSTVDGHATSGMFAFVVDPTGAQAPPAAPPTSSTPSVDGWTVAARWLALVAALVALGTVVSWWQAGRATLASLPPSADRRPPWRLILVASVGMVTGLVLYVVLAARPFAETGAGAEGWPLDVAAPFGWSPFAIAMRISLLSAIAAGLVALVGAANGRRDGGSHAAILAGGCLALALAGMSAAGHAASLGGPISAGLDWFHLIGTAVWLGGLPAIILLGSRVARSGGSGRAAVGEMLRRHARLALIAAPLVVLTGLANSPLVLGSARELVASGYGNLLLLKALLVSLALAIGAANYVLLRDRRRARGGIVLLLGAELVVAAVAVMAAATMVTIQPAAARQPVVAGPSVQPAHFFGEAGPSDLHASVSVPAPGRQSYQVTVRDAATGRPRSDVEGVFLKFTPPAGGGLSSERVELKRGELDGLYAATGAHTPIVGEWGLELHVQRTGATDELASFELLVQEPSAPSTGPPPDTGVGVPAPLALLWSVLPDGFAGWIPALVAGGAVLALSLRSGRWLLLRATLGFACAILVIGAGSRSVVEAANRPTTAELAAHEGGAAGSAEAGERIYLANCASCHGTDGAGDGPTQTLPAARPLSESLASLTDAEVSYRIANGLAGTAMPAFSSSLTNRERRDLVSYLRDRWDSP